MNWFDELFKFVPIEFGAKELVIQAFPVFIIAEGLRLVLWAFLSIIPAMVKGKKRDMANELIEKISDAVGYGLNIWASFYLAKIRGLDNGDALLYGCVSIVMHLVWAEWIYKRYVKEKLKKKKK